MGVATFTVAKILARFKDRVLRLFKDPAVLQNNMVIVFRRELALIIAEVESKFRIKILTPLEQRGIFIVLGTLFL